jgi:hypothetical protein
VINKLCVGLLVVADPRGYAKNMTKRGSGQVPCGSKGRTPQGSALRSTVAKARQLSKA